MSKATPPTAPTPRSSPTRKRTKRSATRSRKRNSASSSSSKRRSILSDRATSIDASWMAQAVRLGEAARGSTAPNPNVGCVIVRDGTIVVGRGATGPGGRPHAEAAALGDAGARAGGATLYTTLEPCAHASPRGPTCADLIPVAGIARVVAALEDPDPRTAGQGFAALREAGIQVTVGIGAEAARAS